MSFAHRGRRAALVAAAAALMIAVAGSTLLGRTAGLYWLVPVMLILIYEAARNAWHLLLQLHPQRPEHEGRRPGRT